MNTDTPAPSKSYLTKRFNPEEVSEQIEKSILGEDKNDEKLRLCFNCKVFVNNIQEVRANHRSHINYEVNQYLDEHIQDMLNFTEDYCKQLISIQNHMTQMMESQEKIFRLMINNLKDQFERELSHWKNMKESIDQYMRKEAEEVWNLFKDYPEQKLKVKANNLYYFKNKTTDWRKYIDDLIFDNHDERFLPSIPLNENGEPRYTFAKMFHLNLEKLKGYRESAYALSGQLTYNQKRFKNRYIKLKVPLFLSQTLGITYAAKDSLPQSMQSSIATKKPTSKKAEQPKVAPRNQDLAEEKFEDEQNKSPTGGNDSIPSSMFASMVMKKPEATGARQEDQQQVPSLANLQEVGNIEGPIQPMNSETDSVPAPMQSSTVFKRSNSMNPQGAEFSFGQSEPSKKDDGFPLSMNSSMGMKRDDDNMPPPMSTSVVLKRAEPGKDDQKPSMMEDNEYKVDDEVDAESVSLDEQEMMTQLAMAESLKPKSNVPNPDHQKQGIIEEKDEPQQIEEEATQKPKQQDFNWQSQLKETQSTSAFTASQYTVPQTQQTPSKQELTMSKKQVKDSLFTIEDSDESEVEEIDKGFRSETLWLHYSKAIKAYVEGEKAEFYKHLNGFTKYTRPNFIRYFIIQSEDSDKVKKIKRKISELAKEFVLEKAEKQFKHNKNFEQLTLQKNKQSILNVLEMNEETQIAEHAKATKPDRFVIDE